MWGILGKLIGKITDKVLPDRSKTNEAQSRINEQEVSGGPASILRLWRSFLGWALALLFVWEVAGRPVVMTYWPGVKLPPSAIDQVCTILMGMLGLGW